MAVMRIVDEYPSREVKVAAAIYPLGPKPASPVPSTVEDEPEDDEATRAKVVRAPHRKTPKATTEGVAAK